MFYYLHALLPKKWLSRQMYRLSRVKQPFFAQALIRLFMLITGASLKDAKRQHVRDYASLNDFFTRELADDARTFATDEHVICSPVDGRVAQADDIDADRILQIKGHDYALSDLVGADYARPYQNGKSITIYLAPDDYHRIHAPEACTLKRAKYLAGEYNSVSISLLDKISGLFAKNERVVYELSTADYDFLLVMVGAVNVSSIETVAHGEIRHDWKRTQPRELTCQSETYTKGDELARFNLGSTVILIYPPKAVNFAPTEFKQRYWLGNIIGQHLS